MSSPRFTAEFKDEAVRQGSMHIRCTIVFFSALLTACASTPTGPADTALEPLERSRLDELYRLPGVDFSRWNTLYVEAPQISYDRTWRSGPRYRKKNDFQLNDREREHLRRQLVKALEAAWGETPGWTLVKEPGPDTLVLQPVLSNFYLYAPIHDDYPGIVRNYTREGLGGIFVGEVLHQFREARPWSRERCSLRAEDRHRVPQLRNVRLQHVRV